MTKIIFETGVIQSSIAKAAVVAPSKGSAFDKAAGVLIEVQPQADYPAITMATDTQTFYMEWINALHVEGDPVTWRLPSKELNAILENLPAGHNHQVTIETDPKGVKLTAGSKRATLYLMTMDGYGEMLSFDPEGLVDAVGLIEKMSQVEWAADQTGAAPLGYIKIDGETVVATDRYRVCSTKLDLKIEEYILVQARTITRVLNKNTHPKIGFENGILQIMPDDHTQIRTVTYEGDYPDLSRIMKRDHPHQLKINKKHLLDAMTYALSLVGSERYPSMDIHVGREQVAASLVNETYGLLGDTVDVPGQADHRRIKLTITPKNLMEALDAAPDDNVTIGYDLSRLNDPLYIHGGGSGWEAWIALRSGKPKP